MIVDHDTVEQFKALGAVSIGRIMLPKRSYQYGVILEPSNDIVHFFAADGLEIGYWTVISHRFGPVIFEQRRNWHPSIKAGLLLEPVS
jgi:hypothetical protein